MTFALKIKNLGKLTDATIDIGNFTVFAGPNNTGKSYVSKLLYSLFDGMNANHVDVKLSHSLKLIYRNLFNMEMYLLGGNENKDIPARHDFSEMRDDIEKIEGMAQSFSLKKTNYENDFDAVRDLLNDINSVVIKIKNTVNRVKEESDKPTGNEQIFPLQDLEESKQKDRINRSFKDTCVELDRLQEILETDPMQFIGSGIEHKICQNMIQNFQVSNLSDLRQQPEGISDIGIEGIGTFKFKGSGSLDLEVDYDGLQKLQDYSRVIYLESPIYWKLKPALEGVQSSPRFHHSLDRERLSGVPGYFDDLMRVLREQYTGDMAFSDLHERLTGKDVIGGKIVISESGALTFQENGRNFALTLIAMGVVNLGMLALLIERKILDKGSFLFVDEPEAHLHPAWQEVISEVLFDLAKGGVNVVIATHSATILKWLEVHVKNNPNDKELVALNKFPINGDEIGEQDFSDKIAAIKQELTKPFADLYMAGL